MSLSRLVRRAGRRDILWHVSNENLAAIVAGLVPSSQDRILAVCGSGDQVFALLEHAGAVYALDKNPDQVKLVENRKKALLRSDYEVFLRVPAKQDIVDRDHEERRNRYFLSEGRLDRIRVNVEALSIRVGDIFSQTGTFNKVYLSNSLTYRLRDSEEAHKDFAAITKRLPEGGLVFVTDMIGIVEGRYKSRGTVGIPSSLAVDVELTKKARETENYEWGVSVFRKVKEEGK